MPGLGVAIGVGGKAIATAGGSAPADAPAAPSGLSAVTSYGKTIVLNWTDNSDDETGFYVYRRVHGVGSYSLIATKGAGVTTHTDSDSSKSAGVRYQYYVTAYEGAVESAASSTASAYVDALYDTFTEGSDTNLTSHTPDVSVGGAGWTKYDASAGTGIWYASSSTGKARYQIGTGGIKYYVQDVGIADCVIRCDWTVEGTNSAKAVLARVTSGTQALEMLYIDSLNAMYQYVRGSGVVDRGNVANNLANGTYACVVTLNGSAVSFVLNGVELATTITDYQSVTKHGLGNSGDSIVDTGFDNYRINNA